MIYFAYFHSILSYGLEVWGNCVDLESVLILQKKAIRIIEGVKTYEHCRPLFIKHKILTVVSLYIYLTSVYVFKNKSKYNCIRDVQSYSLRNSQNLVLPRANYTNYQKSLEHNSIRIFNNLNKELRNCDKIISFSRKLHTYLLDKLFYNLKEYFGHLYD